MRLIHCKKCGAAIVTEDALIERMQSQVSELNEKARRCKNINKARTYEREAASITKMMKGIIHNTTALEERKTMTTCELSELVQYLLENNLITYEKLDELRKIARKKADAKNKENERELGRIYGEYKQMCTPFNNTKKDSTANTAIRNAGRERKQENGTKKNVYNEDC